MKKYKANGYEFVPEEGSCTIVRDSAHAGTLFAWTGNYGWAVVDLENRGNPPQFVNRIAAVRCIGDPDDGLNQWCLGCDLDGSGLWVVDADDVTIDGTYLEAIFVQD